MHVSTNAHMQQHPPACTHTYHVHTRIRRHRRELLKPRRPVNRPCVRESSLFRETPVVWTALPALTAPMYDFLRLASFATRNETSRHARHEDHMTEASTAVRLMNKRVSEMSFVNTRERSRGGEPARPSVVGNPRRKNQY